MSRLVSVPVCGKVQEPRNVGATRRFTAPLVFGVVALSIALFGRVSFVAAHPQFPSVLALLSQDDEGPNALWLTEGLTLRRGRSWTYVCPALWSGDSIKEVASIDGGPIAIASGSGLVLITADGLAMPHPDPAARVPTIAFATLGDTLFALRIRDDLREVVSVQADRVSVRYTTTTPWTVLAAGDDALFLIRSEGPNVERLRLSGSGEAIATDTAPAPDVEEVLSARVTAGVLYLVVVDDAGLAMGRFDPGKQWSPIHTTGIGGTISAPVATADGQLWLSSDFQLYRLDGETKSVIETPEDVSCVGRVEGTAYACVRGGLRSLSSTGIGDRVFQLAALEPPATDRLPADCRRDTCADQWNHFQRLLEAGGLQPVMDRWDGGACGAQVAAAAGSGSSLDAGTGVDAAVGLSPVPPRRSSGCQLTSSSSFSASSLIGMLVLGAMFTCRRARHVPSSALERL